MIAVMPEVSQPVAAGTGLKATVGAFVYNGKTIMVYSPAPDTS